MRKGAFVRLTDRDGKKFYIRASEIDVVGPLENELTFVDFGDTDALEVVESVEEVMAAIVDAEPASLSKVLSDLEQSVRAGIEKYAGDHPTFCGAEHVKPEIDTSEMHWICPECGVPHLSETKIVMNANAQCALLHVGDEFECANCKTKFDHETIKLGIVTA